MAEYAYREHYPAGYADDQAARWPLLIALHGAGERDVTLDVLQTHHYFAPMYQFTSAQYPCIVVIPHCPPRQYWRAELLDTLLDTLLEAERADADRVYLTGFSMGGYGTWLTAEKYPERYAAIAPICGGGEPTAAIRLKHVPIWAFHGAKDPVVPVQETLEMVEALLALDIHPRVTIYPEGNHGVWDETWANEELYAWLLQQRRNGG